MITTKPYKIPVIEGEYVNVYNPSPSVYEGNKTACFEPGQLYDEWIINDFSIIRDDEGFFHIIGITHPKPPLFHNSFDFDEYTVHEAEHQLFHCISPTPSIKECLYENAFREEKKLLWATLRTDEQPECWAPCVYKKGESDYYLFYSPHKMRLARSANLYDYTLCPPLFYGKPMMRDPFVIKDEGKYHIIYVEENLMVRKSTDLINWSEAELFQHNPFGENSAQESPFIFFREGIYYLIWCIHDGKNGCYDNRTFVFASENLYGFDKKAPITIISGHATEVFNDGNEWYIASVYYPKNGINIAKLNFISEVY
jgi:beta-fructofuranosidase